MTSNASVNAARSYALNEWARDNYYPHRYDLDPILARLQASPPATRQEHVVLYCAADRLLRLPEPKINHLLDGLRSLRDALAPISREEINQVLDEMP